jgi:lipid-A-disaccharide synthase
VWVWREGRVKKFKKFLDHVLLLFEFEKKFFDKENIPNTFVGHPLLEVETKNKIDLSNIISNNKKIISLFCGSRSSEVNLLLPVLIDFIIMMNKKFDNLILFFMLQKKIKIQLLKKLK